MNKEIDRLDKEVTELLSMIVPQDIVLVVLALSVKNREVSYSISKMMYFFCEEAKDTSWMTPKIQELLDDIDLTSTVGAMPWSYDLEHVLQMLPVTGLVSFRMTGGIIECMIVEDKDRDYILEKYYKHHSDEIRATLDELARRYTDYSGR